MRRERLVRAEDAPGEQDLLRQRFADEFAQPPERTRRGHDSEARLRVADLQPRRADAEVGRERELGSAAQRPAVESRDDGHRQVGDADEEPGVDALQRIGGGALAQLRDVSAGGENPVAAHQDEDARGDLELRAHGVQLIHHCLVDRVAHRSVG